MGTLAGPRPAPGGSKSRRHQDTAEGKGEMRRKGGPSVCSSPAGPCPVGPPVGPEGRRGPSLTPVPHLPHDDSSVGRGGEDCVGGCGATPTATGQSSSRCRTPNTELNVPPGGGWPHGNPVAGAGPFPMTSTEGPRDDGAVTPPHAGTDVPALCCVKDPQFQVTWCLSNPKAPPRQRSLIPPRRPANGTRRMAWH